jgi:lactoylglutathione lyase
MNVKYLHTMVRVSDLDASLEFYCGKLGLSMTGRHDDEKGRFTLAFLATAGEKWQIELTHNWDPEPLDVGRGFGHLAFLTDDLYDLCDRLVKDGVQLYRPPHDGKVAFVKSPDGVSIELIQRGSGLPRAEPWASMQNTGTW